MVIILYIVFSVGGLILLKLGSDTLSMTIKNGNLGLSMTYISLLGFIAYIISFLLYTFCIIKKYNLSYIYPLLSGLTQILVVLAGVCIFKEHINIPSGIGILLIVVGLILLNIK